MSLLVVVALVVAVVALVAAVIALIELRRCEATIKVLASRLPTGPRHHLDTRRH